MNTSITTPILIPAAALLLIAAVIAVGYQAVSAQDPVEPDRPSAPTGLVASWDVNGVLLEWDGVEGDSIAGYRILRQHLPYHEELNIHVYITGDTESWYVDSYELEDGTTYAYAVIALSETEVGEQSETVSVDTPAADPLPDAVQGLTAERDGPDVRLSWDAHADTSITNFHVSRAKVGDPTGNHWIHLTDSDHSTTSFHDYHDLEEDTTYIYTVGAQNHVGQGPHSASVTITTAPPKPWIRTVQIDPPSAPTNVRVETIHEDGSHRVIVTWDVHASDEGVTGWEISHWDPETGESRGNTRVRARDHTFTRYEDWGLEPDTAYAHSVRAVNAGGLGEPSARVSVTTGSQRPAATPEPTPAAQ